MHQEISFSLEEGESLSVIGASGSGKSSLMSMIMDRESEKLRRVGGDIIIEGHKIFSLSQSNFQQLRSRYIGYLSQHSFLTLNPLLSMAQQLLMVARSHTAMSHLDAMGEIKAITLSLQLSLDDLKKYPYELSGGMASRFALAQVLLYRPKLLIADEITATLDEKDAWELIKLLHHYQKSGTSILFVSHDLNRAQKISDRFIMMDQGKIVDSSSFKELFNHPQSLSAKAKMMVNAYYALGGKNGLLPSSRA